MGGMEYLPLQNRDRQNQYRACITTVQVFKLLVNTFNNDYMSLEFQEYGPIW